MYFLKAFQSATQNARKLSPSRNPNPKLRTSPLTACSGRGRGRRGRAGGGQSSADAPTSAISRRRVSSRQVRARPPAVRRREPPMPHVRTAPRQNTRDARYTKHQCNLNQQ